MVIFTGRQLGLRNVNTVEGRGRLLYFSTYPQGLIRYKLCMLRKVRIDASDALHHVMARGIQRRIIFTDNEDCDDLLERLESIAAETHTSCYAWSLVRNHFHLLLKTGCVPIETVMRRLLTGYAIRFNRRHGRTGHLFQNRYKSILCRENHGKENRSGSSRGCSAKRGRSGG